jgi:hypothetical protein
MTCDEVREQLRAIRETTSVGAILSLLAEVVGDEADAEFEAGDLSAEECSRLAVAALHAVGLGLDAIRRKPGSTP